MGKLKLDEITYSKRSLKQSTTMAKISFHCIMTEIMKLNEYKQ